MEKPGAVKPKPSGRKKTLEGEDKSQAQRFAETARQIGADESGRMFESSFDMILKRRQKDGKIS